jgi:hypothetical protein
LENSGAQAIILKQGYVCGSLSKWLRFAKGVDYGTKLCEQAFKRAYETGDDHFVSWVSWHNGVDGSLPAN